MADRIPIELDCCFNCQHGVNMIGIGFGFRCSEPRNRDNPDLKLKPAHLPPLVPSRRYLCPLFKRRT